MNKNNLVNLLNKRIEIQEKCNNNDGFGGYIEEWKTKQKLWAQIKPITVDNNFMANKIEEKITHIISIRYNKFINTKDRIVYNNRIFVIKGIIDKLESHILLELETEEILLS